MYDMSNKVLYTFRSHGNLKVVQTNLKKVDKYMTSMFNFILFTKLIGTVPRFTIRHIYSLKLLKNSQSALHDCIVLGSSINNLLPTFYLLQNWVNTESNLFANMNLFSS